MAQSGLTTLTSEWEWDGNAEARTWSGVDVKI